MRESPLYLALHVARESWNNSDAGVPDNIDPPIVPLQSRKLRYYGLLAHGILLIHA